LGARGEKGLFRHLCKWLNERGFDLIRVAAQKDGHLLGDEFQPIARPRMRSRIGPNIAFYNGR